MTNSGTEQVITRTRLFSKYHVFSLIIISNNEYFLSLNTKCFYFAIFLYYLALAIQTGLKEFM